MVLIGTVIVGGLALAASIRQPGDTESGLGPISARSRICMLQDTVQGRSGLPYVYGNIISGAQAVSRLSVSMQKSLVTLLTQLTEKSVDKADGPAYAYGGHAYFFSSAANMVKFAHGPQEFVNSTASETTERSLLIIGAASEVRATGDVVGADFWSPQLWKCEDLEKSLLAWKVTIA